MKYAGMPFGMWTLFAAVLPKPADSGVRLRYRIRQKPSRKKQSRNTGQIISELPEFEKARPVQDEPRQLRDDRCVYSLHAGTPGCGAADGVLCKIHDDKADEMVLPQERKKQVYPQRILSGMKADRHLESRRPQPIFVEHGVLRISRRQRLRGTLYQSAASVC